MPIPRFGFWVVLRRSFRRLEQVGALRGDMVSLRVQRAEATQTTRLNPHTPNPNPIPDSGLFQNRWKRRGEDMGEETP